MQMDFHYYATYCAAYLAGYAHEECLAIAYSAQFVDLCSRTLLKTLKAPTSAATTQLQLELMDARTDPVGLQDITRIWSSFHFLPRDLHARRKGCSKPYMSKYRRYKYLPAWGNYEEIVKDNPSDYEHAFRQMVYAMKYLRGASETFEKETYDAESVTPHEAEIRAILTKRQLDACVDWKAFGEALSGQEIPDFDLERYQPEYIGAPQDGKDETFLGKFILAALAQKSLVTNKIFKSGNLCAGFSVDYEDKGFRGMKDFRLLVEQAKEAARK